MSDFKKVPVLIFFGSNDPRPEDGAILIMDQTSDEKAVYYENYLIEAQMRRMEKAVKHGAIVGFVERTHGTNKMNGPCPHYLPKISKINFVKVHICEQCGFISDTYIAPYETIPPLKF